MSLTQPLEDLYPVHPLFLNHDIMHSGAAATKGDYLYSGRALGISSLFDIIQLPMLLMPEYPAISEHYSRIGLAHTNQIIWNVNFEEQRNYTQYETSYFQYGSEQHRVVRNENWYQVVEFINSRNHFIELARQFDMRTPQTLCFETSLQIGRNDLDRIRFPCFIKAAVEVAGAGAHCCENLRELRSRLAYFGTATPIQIQEALKISGCLNLQYQVRGSRLERLAITNKLLAGYEHIGDCFPSPHNAWFSVDIMARWLFSQGMRGIFAFDVAVVADECGIDYLPIACLPRFNSASYAILTARKLDIPRWQLRHYATRFRRITDLPVRDLEYSAAEQSGIILINWGTVLAGNLQVLIAGSPEQQDDLHLELLRRL